MFFLRLFFILIVLSVTSSPLSSSAATADLVTERLPAHMTIPPMRLVLSSPAIVSAGHLSLGERQGPVQPDLDRRGFRPDVQGDQLSVSCGGVGRSRCDNTVFMGAGVPLFKW
jgi:hypothetical protein